MGKRIISQARGKGSLTYRVRRKAFRYLIRYPSIEGEGEIIKILHSAGHSAPLIKIKIRNEDFYNIAFEKAFEGKKINVGKGKTDEGNILQLKEIPATTKIFNIEINPGDGGKMVRSAGGNAFVNKKLENGKVEIVMPNRKKIVLDENCRASIGIVAGGGKTQKPFIKAGRKFYLMKAKGKLWPRTSANAMNAVDHPMGTGRGGKGIRTKSSKRNAPPGRKVGHLRPKRTGRKKK
jgi:large subunit ribosomal protein L2